MNELDKARELLRDINITFDNTTENDLIIMELIRIIISYLSRKEEKASPAISVKGVELGDDWYLIKEGELAAWGCAIGDSYLSNKVKKK